MKQMKQELRNRIKPIKDVKERGYFINKRGFLFNVEIKGKRKSYALVLVYPREGIMEIYKRINRRKIPLKR